MRLINADKLEYKVMAMGSPDFEHEVEICDDCAMAFIDLIHKEKTVEPDMHSKFTKEELNFIGYCLTYAPIVECIFPDEVRSILKKIEAELKEMED